MELQDIARTIRSKNAGAFMITVEIIFDDLKWYNYVKNNGLITRKVLAEAYNVDESWVLDFNYYDPGLGIKANFKRQFPSGGPNESDVYGCQQYTPLLTLHIPELYKV